MREVGKTQAIRVLDVVAIGPAMIWAGYKGTTLHPGLRAFLGITGVLTILYNGQNFLEQRRQL